MPPSRRHCERSEAIQPCPHAMNERYAALFLSGLPQGLRPLAMTQAMGMRKHVFHNGAEKPWACA